MQQVINIQFPYSYFLSFFLFLWARLTWSMHIKEGHIPTKPFLLLWLQWRVIVDKINGRYLQKAPKWSSMIWYCSIKILLSYNQFSKNWNSCMNFNISQFHIEFIDLKMPEYLCFTDQKMTYLLIHNFNTIKTWKAVIIFSGITVEQSLNLYFIARFEKKNVCFVIHLSIPIEVLPFQ